MKENGPLFYMKPEKIGYLATKLIKMYFSQFSELSLIPFILIMLTFQISFMCTGSPIKDIAVALKMQLLKYKDVVRIQKM